MRTFAATFRVHFIFNHPIHLFRIIPADRIRLIMTNPSPSDQLDLIDNDYQFHVYDKYNDGICQLSICKQFEDIAGIGQQPFLLPANMIHHHPPRHELTFYQNHLLVFYFIFLPSSHLLLPRG